jgi:hypothetical protein
MRAIKAFLLVSLLLSGCATELDNKIRSVDQAPTMQNKRDYLLSYSAQRGFLLPLQEQNFSNMALKMKRSCRAWLKACRASDRRSCVKVLRESC